MCLRPRGRGRISAPARPERRRLSRRSVIGIALSVPTTVKLPSLNSMSSAAASSIMRRHRFRLGDDCVGCEAQRDAAHHRTARGEGAAADRDLFRIALDIADSVERNAEPFRDELRERGGVALAVRMRAGDDRHHAARIEPQLHPLVEHATKLDIRRHRPAAQPADLLRSSSAAALETIPVRHARQLVHQPLEFAAVVVVVGRRVIGKRHPV